MTWRLVARSWGHEKQMTRPKRRTAEEFTIPLALGSDARLHAPDSAPSELDYVCPGCETRVTFRRASRARAHFAHRPDVACSSDDRTHGAAIARVMEVVADWAAGSARAPAIEIPCSACAARMPWQPGWIPASTRKEARLAGTTRFPDVAVLDRDIAAVLLVEVHHTNVVDERRARDLSICAWIEVEARDVLEDPRKWSASQCGGLGDAGLCAASIEHRRAAEEARRQRLAAERAESDRALDALRERKQRTGGEQGERNEPSLTLPVTLGLPGVAPDEVVQRRGVWR